MGNRCPKFKYGEQNTMHPSKFVNLEGLTVHTDRSNENGTLTDKHYWNEGTLNGDEIH